MNYDEYFIYVIFSYLIFFTGIISISIYAFLKYNKSKKALENNNKK